MRKFQESIYTRLSIAMIFFAGISLALLPFPVEEAQASSCKEVTERFEDFDMCLPPGTGCLVCWG